MCYNPGGGVVYLYIVILQKSLSGWSMYCRCVAPRMDPIFCTEVVFHHLFHQSDFVFRGVNQFINI
jgi:hypothetical protein